MTSPNQYGQQPPPPTSGGFPPPATPAAGPSSKAPKTGSRSAGRLLLAGLVAVALLLGVASAGLAWRASSKASDALDQIAELRAAPPAQPAAAPVAEPTTEAPTPDGDPPAADPAVTEAEPVPSGSEPVLTKETQFTVKYTDQVLRLPADCDKSTNVDVDEPRVRVDGGADFRFYDPCGPDTPFIELLEGARGSLMTTEVALPVECVDLIRLSPLSTDRQPIRKGQVYCLNTSRANANASADSWKMVIMTISGISSDGVVTIKASAWNIPN